ncbi:DgyrCDS8939 [Dimorphilus gyrociliatus]|uniref:DgyrCDS8939 n=1 Tax=Dimorphilus gyrociliatus TaxID=2664684 RepID=A0A7I8VXB5_9ANNE|nr:DgyrCDS8939 [Dimorphilus gyrociliatus]
MTLAVKAYLTLKDRQEIRRFEIDPAGGFGILQKKAFSIFPGLNQDAIIFSWKDEEGDVINFSTSEELCQAISGSKNLLKIYLTDSLDVASNSEPSGQKHPGVICDGCDGDVVGYRYKCLQCPDYDLCWKCEKKNIHVNHVMARITDPSHTRFPRMFPFAGGFQRHGWGPRGCHKGRGGPRGWWDGWFNRFGQQRPENCGPKTEGATNSNEAPTEDERKQEEIYLKTIGETVSAMLDPFGVDVAVHIDHNGKRETVSGEKTASCPEAASESKEQETKKPEEKNPADWCMVDDDIQEAVSKSLEEKRVNEIVSKLQNMGFVNDDQWLTNLVKEKKADMNAVLDAIHFKV